MNMNLTYFFKKKAQRTTFSPAERTVYPFNKNLAELISLGTTWGWIIRAVFILHIFCPYITNSLNSLFALYWGSCLYCFFIYSVQSTFPQTVKDVMRDRSWLLVKILSRKSIHTLFTRGRVNKKLNAAFSITAWKFPKEARKDEALKVRILGLMSLHCCP